ncbi:MAG TPA: molybdopterin-dependent oxidoreductase [Thermoanaerobacterales bacterium]|nr:molybdopterin-dependent oxidoreductase [Thermoanaerobacterales bacterium]
MQFSFLRKGKVVSILILLLLVCNLGCGSRTQEEIAVGTVVIEGSAVEGKAFLTLEELKSMEEGLVETDYFSLNSYGTKEYFHFKGIWIWHILQEKVSLKDNASKVIFIAEDGYAVEYTLADVQRDDYVDEQNPGVKHKMILAWEEDGIEYDSQQGNPFRLVVGQKETGDVNKPYWVCNVRTIRID